MDSNKVNIRFRVKSKIPVPEKPLPQIPDNLRLHPTAQEIKRQPTKNITKEIVNEANNAGTSTNNDIDITTTETKCPAIVDIRHVTDQQNTANLKMRLNRSHSCESFSQVAKRAETDERHRRHLFDKGLQVIPYIVCLNRDRTEDFFRYLLDLEKKKPVSDIPSESRVSIINWWIMVNGSARNPAVVQSALWYLDSILAEEHIPSQKFQLLAAACYWIAEKIYNREAPPRRLVECSERAFTTEALVETENYILHTLNHPTKPVPSQEFIEYLSWFCDNLQADEINVAATFLCMAGIIIDSTLCREYPSVIGAAAVKNAVLLLRNDETMVKLQSNPVYQVAETRTFNISHICYLQRKAVRLISSAPNEFKALLSNDNYDVPSYCVVQKIIRLIN